MIARLPRRWVATCACLMLTACASTTDADSAAAATPPPDSVWAWFAARYDANGDGRVTAGELGRGDESFRNYDRNGDGVVTAGDFDAPLTMPPNLALPFLLVRMFGAPGADAVRLEEIDAGFARVDANHDGRITRAEVEGDASTRPAPPPGSTDRFGTMLRALDADHDGALTRAEVRAGFIRRDVDHDGVMRVRERARPGVEPRVGFIPLAEREPAPDFTLAPDDGGAPIRLASFAGDRPVALIFGSFT